MTTRLEELFDLPTDEESIEPVEQDDELVFSDSTKIATQQAMSSLDKIDEALPAIRGLEASDAEMDKIAKKAMASYKDLMDLGMNVEARVATEILSSASQFLGHAITAKNSKINKKLRMVELQLRKARLELDIRKAAVGNGDGNDETVGEGKMLDRNELLAEIISQNKRDESKSN